MYWMELSQREFSEIFSGWQLEQMVEVIQLHSGLMQVYNLGRVGVKNHIWTVIMEMELVSEMLVCFNHL